MATAALLLAVLLPDEQSRLAKGLRERKRKVKAHSAMRERSSMPPALLPVADGSSMPTFGWCTQEDKETFKLKKKQQQQLFKKCRKFRAIFLLGWENGDRVIDL